MKKVGIICEYNPFHNGHIYHLEKIKEIFPDSLIILVMSGNYTMRGEISLLNKWDKTEISLNYGVDLVIELPVFYATNSADIFAEGSIKLLKELKCDYLVFGSESNDIKVLEQLANIQLNNQNYNQKVKEYLDKGLNYPTSMSKALNDLGGKDINSPNDLLGLSYIKEIIKQKANIIPLTIKRTNNYHEKSLNNDIASGTSIRNALDEGKDISKVIPKETKEKIITNYQNNFFSLLKYQILNNYDDLDKYLDVDEGLDNLIRKNIQKANNYRELINLIKTKRYTYNRLNRMFLHILLNVKKSDITKRKEINYIKILGFTNNGKKYLKTLKNDTSIPIITNYSDIKDDNLTFELNTSFIYHQIINQQELNLKELKSIPVHQK